MELTILDLPQDVIELIFLHLHPRSFLHLCCLTRQFWQDQHRNPTYWRVTTCVTFRVPVSPLLHAEGDRWYWLYKKLRTQTKAFSWGQGSNGELGLPMVVRRQSDRPLRRFPRPNIHWIRGRHRPAAGLAEEGSFYERGNRSWPTEADVPDVVGVIADLQCGGWSTTLLNAQGDLYSVGILDQDEGRPVGQSYDQLTRLDYRSKVPIRRFSAGRKHVLGLDDEGYVWSWDRINVPAWQIHDVAPIQASRVVGGWTVSSAYTKEGIIYWRVPRGVTGEGTEEARTPLGSESLAASDTDSTSTDDGARISVKTTIIPGTDFRSSPQQREPTHPIGQVLAHIVLEAYIVFITSLDKVFAHRIADDENSPPEPSFEAPAFSSALTRHLKDIQGTFRKFSVFTSTGEVLSGDQQYLEQLHRLRADDANASALTTILLLLDPSASTLPRPPDIPSLQNTGVTSLAYGDHHFHALHSSGRIISYGTDPQCCGALGLGSPAAGLRFRGIKVPDHNHNPWHRDATLLPIAYKHGREVWFQDEMDGWLRWMEGADEREPPHPALKVIKEQEARQAGFSEWVEREGRAWEEGVSNEDGLGGFFAMKVAAAGWHSAALVLVDEGVVRRVSEKWQVTDGDGEDDGDGGGGDGNGKEKEKGKVRRAMYKWEKGGFPRIALPDGFVFPGPGELREWKGGMPLVEELGIAG